MGDMELQIFADRLKELRTSLQLTQAQFVDGLGITASSLSAYEKNLKNPSISVAKRIAEKYHVSVDWLCGLSQQKCNDNEPKTYGDTIKILDEACKILKFKVSCKKPYYISVSDNVMGYFLRDWSKILDLYYQERIDEKLYQFWLEDKIKEYDAIHINSTDEVMDFLSYMGKLDKIK